MNDIAQKFDIQKFFHLNSAVIYKYILILKSSEDFAYMNREVAKIIGLIILLFLICVGKVFCVIFKNFSDYFLAM